MPRGRKRSASPKLSVVQITALFMCWAGVSRKLRGKKKQSCFYEQGERESCRPSSHILTYTQLSCETATKSVKMRDWVEDTGFLFRQKKSGNTRKLICFPGLDQYEKQKQSKRVFPISLSKSIYPSMFPFFSSFLPFCHDFNVYV